SAPEGKPVRLGIEYAMEVVEAAGVAFLTVDALQGPLHIGLDLRGGEQRFEARLQTVELLGAPLLQIGVGAFMWRNLRKVAQDFVERWRNDSLRILRTGRGSNRPVKKDHGNRAGSA